MPDWRDLGALTDYRCPTCKARMLDIDPPRQSLICPTCLTAVSVHDGQCHILNARGEEWYAACRILTDAGDDGAARSDS